MFWANIFFRPSSMSDNLSRMAHKIDFLSDEEQDPKDASRDIDNEQGEHAERNSNSRASLEANSRSRMNRKSVQGRRSEGESENESQSYSKRQREYRGWGYSQVIQTYPEWRVLETYQENYDEEELKKQFPPSSPVHESVGRESVSP